MARAVPAGRGWVAEGPARVKPVGRGHPAD
jgi:hypothetical protein